MCRNEVYFSAAGTQCNIYTLWHDPVMYCWSVSEQLYIYIKLYHAIQTHMQMIDIVCTAVLPSQTQPTWSMNMQVSNKERLGTVAARLYNNWWSLSSLFNRVKNSLFGRWNCHCWSQIRCSNWCVHTHCTLSSNRVSTELLLQAEHIMVQPLPIWAH